MCLQNIMVLACRVLPVAFVVGSVLPILSDFVAVVAVFQCPSLRPHACAEVAGIK